MACEIYFNTFLLDPKMTGKTYIMGCTIDGLAFGTAAEGLQHYNGKKHRAKMARHLKDLTQENCAIHIKGTHFITVRLNQGVVHHSSSGY